MTRSINLQTKRYKKILIFKNPELLSNLICVSLIPPKKLNPVEDLELVKEVDLVYARNTFLQILSDES